MSDDETYGIRYDWETFLRRVLVVRETAMRRRQLHRQLMTLDAETAAEHLERCVRETVRGNDEARDVLFAFAAFVDQAEGREGVALDAIDLEARRAGRTAVNWLLLDPPPARAIDGLRLQQARGRALTLGERRAAAAGWDPRMIERLTLDNEPMVIDRLCANPRLGEPHVLAILTRRPTRPELITTVARHERWYARSAVREAIVQNPYGPTGLALRTLPIAPWGIVERVQHAGDLHETVRTFARFLCLLREGREDGPHPDSLVPTLH